MHVGSDPHEPQQQAMLRAAVRAARIRVGDLWLHYFSIGGTVGEYEVDAYLQGLLSLPVLQRDLLAMAANELITAMPRPRAPYSDELADSTKDSRDSAGKDDCLGPMRLDPNDPE